MAHAVALGVPGDQRRRSGGEVVGGDAAQARDLQREADRAQARRRQSLEDVKPALEREDTDTMPPSQGDQATTAPRSIHICLRLQRRHGC